jgi:hypothetical protein
MAFALAHVRMTGREPDLHASRYRNHRRRLPFASALISADTVEASTAPAIRIRPPAATSISITPAFSAEAGNPGSAAIATELNAAGLGARSQSCRRHRNNWLVWTPAARATSEANRARLHRRRNEPFLLPFAQSLSGLTNKNARERALFFALFATHPARIGAGQIGHGDQRVG